MPLTQVNAQMLDGAITANSSGNVGIGYRDWETDRKSTRLNSSHRL